MSSSSHILRCELCVARDKGKQSRFNLTLQLESGAELNVDLDLGRGEDGGERQEQTNWHDVLG